jgi:hypothetical protein
MVRHIKGKDGKFAGSIGNGKSNVPTAAVAPARSSAEPSTEVSSSDQAALDRASWRLRAQRNARMLEEIPTGRAVRFQYGGNGQLRAHYYYDGDRRTSTLVTGFEYNVIQRVFDLSPVREQACLDVDAHVLAKALHPLEETLRFSDMRDWLEILTDQVPDEEDWE